MSETTTATPILDPQKFTMQDYLARERPIRGLAERDALDAGATVEYQLAKETRSVVALVTWNSSTAFDSAPPCMEQHTAATGSAGHP
jgi:hypothetical protein